MNTKVTEVQVKKILELISYGLVKGLGIQKPGMMCVEAVVNAALGLKHGDKPPCVHNVLNALKIRLNDSCWSSDKIRAKGLKKLAILQLDTKNNFNEQEFCNKIKVKFPNYAADAYADDYADADADAAAYTAADAAAYTAAYDADAAYADKILNSFAEGVCEILIEMNVPGCKWLYLLEE
jgi:hypothetical protein